MSGCLQSALILNRRNTFWTERQKLLSLKLNCGYKYTRPCMINRILGLSAGRGFESTLDLYIICIFILNFSPPPPRSAQLGGAQANEIKHDHSPAVIVVLDKDTINHTRSCILIAAVWSMPTKSDIHTSLIMPYQMTALSLTMWLWLWHYVFFLFHSKISVQ